MSEPSKAQPLPAETNVVPAKAPPNITTLAAVAQGMKSELFSLLKQKMENEKEDRAEVAKLEVRVRSLEEKVRENHSAFHLDMAQLKRDVLDTKGGAGSTEQLSLAVEENRVKLSKLEGKCELLMALLERNNCTTVKGFGDNCLIEKMTSFDLNNGSAIAADFQWQLPARSVESQWFKCRGYPMVGRVKVSQDYYGLPCLSLKLESRKQESLKILPNVYYLLRNGSGEDEEPVCVNAFYAFANEDQLTFKYTLKDSKQLNGRILEVYVEPPSMTREVHSRDGSLTWTMGDFSKRNQMERDGLVDHQESPYFYTAPRGYRVRLHVYLDGSGVYKETGLTVRVSFLTGEYDEELRHDFPHRTSICLINQSEVLYDKKVQSNIVHDKSYPINVCEAKDLLFAIDNDAITFKVTVDGI